MKKLDLPYLLIEAVKSGRAILFLGAGASKECRSGDGRSPPNGAQLKDSISERFFGRAMPKHDLMSVAEMAIENAGGYSSVFEHVNSAFSGFETSDAHRSVTGFNWRTIATTNYDTFLESAYSDIQRRRQTLIPFVKDDEPVERRMREVMNPLQYLKLHGCLDHRLDKDVPLVLAWEQYGTYAQNRTRLFGRLKDLAREYPIVFVGYRLGDSHIRTLINDLGPKNRPRWYIVDPDAEEDDVKLWASKNVDVFACRFGEFMTALDGAIPPLMRLLTPPKEAVEFPLRTFYATQSEESDQVRASVQKDLTLVHASMSFAEQTAERFYSGYDTGWGGILDRLDTRRKVTDDLLFKVLVENEVPTAPLFFLLRGPAGAGKTIALKRAAFDAATANKALVFWLEESGQLRPDVFSEISDLVRRPIYLFVDQVALQVDKLLPFMKAMKSRRVPIVIVGAEREADWTTYCLALEDVLMPQFLRVGTLSTGEVEMLLDLLARHGCLGELADKTREEQVDAFMSEEQADRQLLVALHVLTKGLPFEDIVLNEYRTVNPERARRLYLDIATMNQFAVQVRAGTISRVSGIDFREYEEQLFSPLKDMVIVGRDRYTGDYAYRTRHARVAQILFRRVCDDDALKSAQFIRLIDGMDVGFASDSRALEGICRGRTLSERFSDPEAVRRIYEAAVSAAPKQAYLYQQWAIFESTHPSGDFLQAESLAESASSMEPGSASFLHTQAEVARKRANREGSSVLKEQLRRRTRSFLEKMPRSSRFTVSSRCKLLVDEVVELGDRFGEVEKTSEDRFFAERLKEVETALSRAQQDFPDDAEMFETEARLWTEMKEKKRALKALERAWKKGPKGSGTAIRIGKIYAAAGRGEDQHAVLKEALDRKPDDKAIHFAMAMHVMEKEDADFARAERHLTDSFSSDDQNFEARYTLAQVKFARGDVSTASDMFAEVHRRAPKEFRRMAPRTDTAITARLPTYRGTVDEVGEKFSFIRSGAYPTRIYAHRTAFDEAEVEDLQIGREVEFRIRFNRSGPVAIVVRFQSHGERDHEAKRAPEAP